jgi:hypothetical protein
MIFSPSLLKAEDYKVSPQGDPWNENHLETEEERSKNAVAIKPK